MKLKLLFAQLIFFLATTVAFADDTAPYETIAPQPTASGNKIEVIEFFWYGCPHCFSLEPYLEKWLAKKPDDVIFRRIPAILGNNWVHYARVYYAADKLGVVDKLHSPLFNAIHQQKIPLDDGPKLGNFLNKLGIDKDKFFAAYQSEEIGKEIKNAYAMGQDYGLTGVPTIIINGKYRTSASQAGSNEKLIQVMDELIEKERAAAATASPQTETSSPVEVPAPAPAVPAQPQTTGKQQRLNPVLASVAVAVIFVLISLFLIRKRRSRKPAG